MARLNTERQEKLEPQRLEKAAEAITGLGYKLTVKTKSMIQFIYKNHPIMFFPYSGWHSGQTIRDGRGLQNLLKQLK